MGSREPDHRHGFGTSRVEPQLGYKLGYSREPVPGIAHPIAIPAPARW